MKAILIRPSGSTTIRDFKGYRDAMKLLSYAGEGDPLGYIHGGPGELTGSPHSSFLCRTQETETRKKYKPNPVAGFMCGKKLVGPALLFGWDPTKTELAAHQSVINAGETMRYITGTVRHFATGVEDADDAERQDCIAQAIGNLGLWRSGAITVQELHEAQFIPKTAWADLVAEACRVSEQITGDHPGRRFARGLVCSMSMIGATRDKMVMPQQMFAEVLGMVDTDTAAARDCLLECCVLTAALDRHMDSVVSVSKHVAHLTRLLATDEGTNKLIEHMDTSLDGSKPTDYGAKAIKSWSNALLSAMTEWDAK